MRDRQAGFVLPELLTVMVVSTLLLGATLFTFTSFISNANESDRANDAAETARTTLDIEARQLRNLGRRTDSRTNPEDPNIAQVGADDFVFRTSDPTRTWVRYCLDLSQGAANGRLWQHTRRADDPPAASTSCPATSGWEDARIVGSHIVNRYAGRTLPLFSYRCIDGTTACTAAASDFDEIVGVSTQLVVDTTPGKAPDELHVTSGVYLRNQNQAPVVTFTATPVSGMARTVQLNASGSYDFEGRTLQFYWFQGTMPTSSKIFCNRVTEKVVGTSVTLWDGRLIGRGVVLRHTSAVTPPGTDTIGLVACDPGDRSGFVVKAVPITS